MFKTVSKKAIIEALKTEPLRHGSWYRAPDTDNNASGECQVCAVGAVLRGAAKAEPSAILNFGSRLFAYFGVEGMSNASAGRKQALKYVKSGDYMAALSTYFESLSGRGTVLPKNHPTRKHMVKFVQKYFPDRVRIAA